MASQPYQLMELGTTAADFGINTTLVMELGTDAADFQNNVRERQTLDIGAAETDFDIVTITLYDADVLDMGAEDAGFDVTATLPTDSRTTWLDVVATARDACHEVQPVVRTKQVKQMPYGTVTVYGRQFVIPRGNVGQAILEDVLARGSHMRSIWASEWFSLALDGPKAGDAEVQQHVKDGKATGADIVSVPFIAIKTLATAVDGYNMTRKLLPRGTGAFADEGVSYGIAPSRTATGVPAVGDIITAYQPYDVWRCTGTAFDDDTLPGRVLVMASWVRHKQETTIVEPADG